MSAGFNNWQAVQDEVRRRIHAREWKPGEFIPNEADLAREFRCARATVNRALRSLADAGLLDRRRKAGTRVAVHPVRKATLRIPLLRQEIETRGHEYSYALLSSDLRPPPEPIGRRMRLNYEHDHSPAALHLSALHSADGRPYVFEDRWINPASVPAVLNVDFSQQNANEWLVAHAPFTHGDIVFGAHSASQREAEVLAAQAGDALFLIERSTWDGTTSITSVRLVFAPGYRMQTDI